MQARNPRESFFLQKAWPCAVSPQFLPNGFRIRLPFEFLGQWRMPITPIMRRSMRGSVILLLSPSPKKRSTGD